MCRNHKGTISILIESCLEIQPQLFLPELKKNSICTNMPNKLRFYKYFEYMITCLNCNSDRILSYKWKKTKWFKKSRVSLQIFDSSHKCARLTFIVETYNNKLYIEIIPL